MTFAINKSNIEKRMRSKSDSELVNLIIKLKKTNPIVAKEFARPKRRWSAVNLKDIDMTTGDVLIVGKVLSAGDISSPKKIVAWNFSKKAIAKIRDAEGEAVLVTKEVLKNAELNGLEILKND
jgi:ribosomal protein L18E